MNGAHTKLGDVLHLKGLEFRCPVAFSRDESADPVQLVWADVVSSFELKNLAQFASQVAQIFPPSMFPVVW